MWLDNNNIHCFGFFEVSERYQEVFHQTPKVPCSVNEYQVRHAMEEAIFLGRAIPDDYCWKTGCIPE